MTRIVGRALVPAAPLLITPLAVCDADGDGPVRFGRVAACFRVQEAGE